MVGTLANRSNCLSRKNNCFRIPNTADFLFMYSSFDGFYSFRDRNGSWFIQALCDELCKNAHEEINTILNRVKLTIAFKKESCSVNLGLNDLKQMPVVHSTLTKSLIFKKQNYEK
ncbi:hypothetical protein PVAND_000420 [Polypedilum vanderplanki]|uniref:Caspase family p10 domain-containing protein n=1 Tax=Polypedilum vanderplanki TaxID=319348 RepID=A0A9J6BK68_POLVA|nr:hypothetical protein PVAND_000420 [Polypedilum vanderplanki]